ncbi:MAG: site-2 protease family protein [Candidatus Caldarchaeum sp.]|nr:site-2 protease family protein [Candidatus Caldarchaeum sp.]MCX8201066.1 site-2 protease family protein [Candidatus Caldarchaeum sp.]MDW8063871.1 site-2 protease family protein [Candidatus Caldarchaeum sp.]MDW8435232.1 site-2 protease family protein [Candidatus Caldarchaeum sp.]
MSGGVVDYDAAKNAVYKYFTVSNVYLEAGVLTFEVLDGDIKERFKKCLSELKTIGCLATARRENDVIKLRIFPHSRPPKNDLRIPLILGIITLATVTIDGVLRSSSRVFSILVPGFGFADVLSNGLLFSLALLGIIFIHEMGHKLSAKVDGVSASLPYFIPGFPGVIPTLGAVIFQKEPLANRDDMFDIGASGPVAGFLVAVAVTIIAFETAVWVPVDQYRNVLEAVAREGTFVQPPLLFNLVAMLYNKTGYVPFFMTVGFAAWLGMVVTALNLMPIWQLDGGRIFRSFLSPRQHMIASYIALGFLVIAGYYFMAILLILMMGRNVDIPPLDDVSPLSFWRKVSLIGLAAMFALSFVPMIRIF